MTMLTYKFDQLELFERKNMRMDGKQFSSPTFYVDSNSDLDAVVEELLRCRRLGVDTESNSLYAFRERVCTIQISSVKANYIFDPIRLEDLSALSPIFADPKIEKIFHGADYDIGLLKRDFGYECRRIFDTMVASQFLNFERIGMADLVEKYFGVRLEKKFTKSDWTRRPLSIEQIVYLCQDTMYLIEMKGRLYDELVEKNLLEEAELEFDHLENRQPLEPAYEHLTVWDIKGVKGLDDKELPVMYELFKWRQERAARVNLPPFKVVNNKTLLDIAKARPRNKEELTAIKGITTTVWHRNGQDMLNAVRRGDRLPASKVPPQSKARRNDARQPVHWNDQHAVDSLKKWRNLKAEERGIHHLAVLPGYALENIARLRPPGSEALSAIQGVGKKRAELYGEEILDIIKNLKH